MTNIKVKVTDEEFKKYKSLDKASAEREFLNTYDSSKRWEYGYGVYGFYLTEYPYVKLTIGDSCD